MKLLLPMVAVVVAASAVAPAEVVDSAAGGFTVQSSWSIQASPTDVYAKLTAHVADWWNPAHTFSGDAGNLTMDTGPGGCFCEKLPGGGGVQHMTVAMAMPGKMLLLHGGMGPLLSLAATGSMKFALSPEAGGTRLQFTYTVGGYLPAGLNTFAAPVDSVLKEQIARLKNYVETGRATGAEVA